MAAGVQAEVTHVLNQVSGGDRSAADRLMPLVYDTFRSLADRYMSRETPGHTMQPTDLVHEAFLKLVDQTRVDWKGRTHFFAVGAVTMRRILVNHAKAKGRQKRGGNLPSVIQSEELAISIQSYEDILAIDQVLEELAQRNARHAQIVELRFFGGLGGDEIAEALGVSRRTVTEQWRIARAWLRARLSGKKEQ